MSNTWFTSDLHFGHIRILEYCRSEFFNDLDHMREMIVYNWNSVVEPEDTVYIIGDAVMGQRDIQLPTFNRLNGYKILILGNHDYPHPCNKEKFITKWTPIYEEYFDELHLRTEIEIAGGNVLLCHFPAEGDHTEDERYPQFRPVDYEGVIIHGHLHVKDIWVAPKHVHIGIDSDWTYFGIPRYHPIPIETVAEAVSLSSEKEISND